MSNWAGLIVFFITTGPALSAGAHTTTCACDCDGYNEYTFFFVKARFLRHGNKNTLSLVMVYSALFNNVFEALNLFLNKYLAAAIACSPYHRGSTQSSDMAWHLVINITICIEQRQLQLTLTVSCSWAEHFCSNPGYGKPFLSFHQSAKHSPPNLSSSWSGQDGNQGSTLILPLGLCVLYYRSPCTPCLPHEWKDGKSERSPVYWSRWSLHNTTLSLQERVTHCTTRNSASTRMQVGCPRKCFFSLPAEYGIFWKTHGIPRYFYSTLFLEFRAISRNSVCICIRNSPGN